MDDEPVLHLEVKKASPLERSDVRQWNSLTRRHLARRTRACKRILGERTDGADTPAKEEGRGNRKEIELAHSIAGLVRVYSALSLSYSGAAARSRILSLCSQMRRQAQRCKAHLTSWTRDAARTLDETTRNVVEAASQATPGQTSGAPRPTIPTPEQKSFMSTLAARKRNTLMLEASLDSCMPLALRCGSPADVREAQNLDAAAKSRMEAWERARHNVVTRTEMPRVRAAVSVMRRLVQEERKTLENLYTAFCTRMEKEKTEMVRLEDSLERILGGLVEHDMQTAELGGEIMQKERALGRLFADSVWGVEFL